MPTMTERPGAKAHLREVRMSASKVRLVLNLIRGKRIGEAMEILEFTERLAADPVSKLLASAVANAGHNEDIPAEELFVSECYADEGPTMKRFRPRARGRAGKIHKQTAHVTIVVSRLTDEEIEDFQLRAEAKAETRGSKSSVKKKSGGDRSARVAKSKKADDVVEDDVVEQDVVEDASDAVEASDTVEEDASDAVEADAASDAVEDASDAVDEDVTEEKEED